MTNTHVNVGGHKITTNKTGQVHTITSFPTGFSGRVDWCVINGICTVNFHPIVNTATANASSIVENLPKCKIPTRVLQGLVSGMGTVAMSIVFIEANSNTLKFSSDKTGNSYGSFSYPVADDWSE